MLKKMRASSTGLNRRSNTAVDCALQCSTELHACHSEIILARFLSNSAGSYG